MVSSAEDGKYEQNSKGFKNHQQSLINHLLISTEKLIGGHYATKLNNKRTNIMNVTAATPGDQESPV